MSDDQVGAVQEGRRGSREGAHPRLGMEVADAVAELTTLRVDIPGGGNAELAALPLVGVEVTGLDAEGGRREGQHPAP